MSSREVCAKMFQSAWKFDGVTGSYVVDFWYKKLSKVLILTYILVKLLCRNRTSLVFTSGETDHLTKCAQSIAHSHNNDSKTVKNYVNPSNFHFRTMMVWLWVVITKSKLRVTLTYYISTCAEFCKESFTWSQINFKIHSSKVTIHLLKVSKRRVQFGVSKLMTITGIYICFFWKKYFISRRCKGHCFIILGQKCQKTRVDDL